MANFDQSWQCGNTSGVGAKAGMPGTRRADAIDPNRTSSAINESAASGNSRRSSVALHLTAIRRNQVIDAGV